MGIFSFFSKEKKETLDKGLEKTKESFFGKLTRAVAGKSKVDDDVLDRLEEVLVTSDVGVDTTLNIIDRIEKRVARDKYVTVNELNDILRDEIASLLTENNTADTEGFVLPEGKKPYVIMVVHELSVDDACPLSCLCLCALVAVGSGSRSGGQWLPALLYPHPDGVVVVFDGLSELGVLQKFLVWNHAGMGLAYVVLAVVLLVGIGCVAQHGV